MSTDYMTDATYSLSRRATVCPRCGHKTFKAFVDPGGNILSPEAGRCNREIKCGYFMSLRQYFISRGHRPRRPASDSHTQPAASPPPPPQPSPPPSLLPPVPIPDYATFLADSQSRNPLLSVMLGRFDTAQVWTAVRHYRVTTHPWGGGSCLFPLIDADGATRSGKLMVYDHSGHRVHPGSRRSATQWLHTLPGARTDKGTFNLCTCFFGTHLLTAYPDATAVMVESEKTALLLATYLNTHALLRCGASAHPDVFPRRYIPIATGGLTNLSCDLHRALADPSYRWHPLRHRRLLLVPDADAVDRWKEIALRAPLHALAAETQMLDIRHWGATGSADIGDLVLARRYYGDFNTFDTAPD